MLLPYQQYEPQQYQTFVNSFGGLNLNIVTRENEFSDMENMSGDGTGLIGTRPKRVTVKTFGEGERVNGFASKNAIIYTVDDGSYSRLFLNDREVEGVQLSRADKTIIGMGAYAVIFPDGFYINTVDTSDKGFIGNRWEITATQAVPLRLTPCTYDGSALSDGTVGPTAPATPENGDVWVDTSGSTAVYKIWNEATGSWAQMSTVYIRFDYAGIEDGFRQWDGVSISGLSYEGEDDTLQEQIASLNLDGALLQQVGDGFLEIAGIINQAVELTGTIVIERKLPQLDYVTESGNRLWGCRFGVVDGKVVNEILACKQGDCRNWFSYPGISTDSYALSVGTDGAFTGAITYLGTPIFFKENYIHKIYGSMPSNYAMQQTTCRGIGRGMADSIVTDGSAVFYRSAVDFCAYSGGYPQEISQKLASLRPDTVRSGCLGSKVYNYIETQDERCLLVFDTDSGNWYKETCDIVHGFAKDGFVMYMLLEDADGLFRIDSVNEDFRTLLVDQNGEVGEERDITWSATTGDIGFGDINAKYVKMIQVRAKLGHGSTLRVEISYDGAPYREFTKKQGDDRAKAITCQIKPARCDSFRLRFSGVGACTLVSVAKTIGQGSEKR